MIYTLSKELEQELIVSAPELQPSYAAIVEYLEAINQKEASGSNSQELQNQLAIQLGRLEDLVQGYIHTLLFGKVRKSEMRGSPQKNVLYLHFNHKTDLTFLIKTFTIKVRSLCVVLMISPLVVRRTFYLIVNDLSLLK